MTTYSLHLEQNMKKDMRLWLQGSNNDWEKPGSLNTVGGLICEWLQLRIACVEVELMTRQERTEENYGREKGTRN